MLAVELQPSAVRRAVGSPPASPTCACDATYQRPSNSRAAARSFAARSLRVGDCLGEARAAEHLGGGEGSPADHVIPMAVREDHGLDATVRAGAVGERGELAREVAGIDGPRRAAAREEHAAELPDPAGEDLDPELARGPDPCARCTAFADQLGPHRAREHPLLLVGEQPLSPIDEAAVAGRHALVLRHRTRS